MADPIPGDADPRPGEGVPAAGLTPAEPSPAASPDAAPPAEPTRVDRDGRDASTVDAPVRWSGSAAVPPPSPKRARWSRRAAPTPGSVPAPPVAAPPVAAPPVPPTRESEPTTTDPEDWSAMPAVDPWADQDTPWDLGVPEILPPTRADRPLPPTRMDRPLPPTRMDRPLPPTRMDRPLPPTRMDRPLPPTLNAPPVAPPPNAAAPFPTGPPPTAASTTTPPAAAPPGPPSRQRRGWGRKKKDPVPANRVPIAARPPTPPPRPAPVPQAWRPPGRPAPPARPLPPPPRRRRRWPRNLALFTLLSAVCCCGIPAYYAWPAARQYPVSADLPSSVADLNLRDDSASRRAVEKLTQDLKDTNSSVDDVFAGIYSDGDGKRVTLFGTTGLRFTPESDINSELQHLSSTYDIRHVQPFDLGEAGAHERCGVGDAGGKSVVVCAWADHGSLATVLLTRRSVADSARLVGILRSAVLTRG